MSIVSDFGERLERNAHGVFCYIGEGKAWHIPSQTDTVVRFVQEHATLSDVCLMQGTTPLRLRSWRSYNTYSLRRAGRV